MLPSIGQCTPTTVPVVCQWALTPAKRIINKVRWDTVHGPCTAWWIRVELTSQDTPSACCVLHKANSEYSQNAVIMLGNRICTRVLCQKYCGRFFPISIHRVDQSRWNFHRWLVRYSSDKCCLISTIFLPITKVYNSFNKQERFFFEVAFFYEQPDFQNLNTVVVRWRFLLHEDTILCILHSSCYTWITVGLKAKKSV
jgi:hypothetical protein